MYYVAAAMTRGVGPACKVPSRLRDHGREHACVHGAMLDVNYWVCDMSSSMRRFDRFYARGRAQDVRSTADN
jgi:hypothetical protein